MKIPEWSLPTGTTFFSILVQFPIIPKRHWVPSRKCPSAWWVPRLKRGVLLMTICSESNLFNEDGCWEDLTRGLQAGV